MFEYPAKNPIYNRLFNTAMLNHTIMITNKIVESYKGFENLKHMVDVGGGVGTTLGIITNKYPTIKAINYDLPHVIQNAVPYPGNNSFFFYYSYCSISSTKVGFQ